MPFLSPPSILLSTVAVLAVVGCGDTTPLAPPSSAAAELSVLAKAPARPTGTGMGLIGSKGNRTKSNVEYHGGALMLGGTPVYFIWYGNWAGSVAPTVLADLASNLGGSRYFDAVTRYPNASGTAPSNNVQYAGSIFDSYSLGTSLANYDISFIVGMAILDQKLPSDPNGVYVVFTSPDVAETSGFGTAYCGFHSLTSVNSVMIKVVFVGHPDRAPTKCKPDALGPNGGEADAIANTFVNGLFNSIVDPEFTGWYDRFMLEPADKCAWTFGTTYTSAGNGARANVPLGGRDYLLQQLWVPGKSGYCTLDANATP
jgi:hypothetical protein